MYPQKHKSWPETTDSNKKNSLNDDDDDDDWCFTAISKGNQAKSKMKHPSDMPTPRFELMW